MENDKFMQLALVLLITILALLAFVGLTRGLLLEEGECWTYENTTVCAVNCTEITEDACEDFIVNRTHDLEDKCLSFQNLSDQINSTFGTIGEGFLDDCYRWKNASRSWEEDYIECDKRLQSLDVDTVDELNESLDSATRRYSNLKDDYEDLEDEIEVAQSNLFTATGLAFAIGLFLMWWFKVRKREGSVEAEPEGMVPSEVM